MDGLVRQRTHPTGHTVSGRLACSRSPLTCMIETSTPAKTLRQEMVEIWHTFRHLPRIIYRIVSFPLSNKLR